MNQAMTSMARILAAPWQQRRNQRAMWGIWLIVAMVASAPALLLIGSVVSQVRANTPLAVELFGSAGRSAGFATGALLAGWWLMQVASVLNQNHPTLARMVPAHVRRLRWFLLAAWLALTALAASAGACVNDAPLLWAAIVGGSLALVAMTLRRPALWALGCLSPFAVNYATRPTHWVLIDAALAAVERTWHANAVAFTATVLAASATLLVAVVQSGGSSHIRFHERRSSANARFAKHSVGAVPVGADDIGGWLSRVAATAYYAWLQRVVTQPHGSVHARVLLALGPATHWTSRVSGVAIALAAVMAGTLAVVAAPFAETLPLVLGAASVGIVFALMSPMLQLQARLHQTRREQALLMLLPGMPRGPALSRWLSWQFTWQFLGTWLGCLGLMGVCALLSNAFYPGVFANTFATGRAIMAAAFLPLAALAWRPWARLPAPTQLNALLPSLAGMGIAAVMFFGVVSGRYTLLKSAPVFAVAALAWCAWRWQRMASEPSALPIGRLAG